MNYLSTPNSFDLSVLLINGKVRTMENEFMPMEGLHRTLRGNRPKVISFRFHRSLGWSHSAEQWVTT